MPIIPEMIGSVVGVYNGQFFVNVEIKVCWIFPKFFFSFFVL
jgi:ribosomal protein S19